MFHNAMEMFSNAFSTVNNALKQKNGTLRLFSLSLANKVTYMYVCKLHVQVSSKS